MALSTASWNRGSVLCQVESSPPWWRLCHKVDLHSELDTGLLFASQIPVIAADIRRGFSKKFNLHRWQEFWCGMIKYVTTLWVRCNFKTVSMVIAKRHFLIPISSIVTLRYTVIKKKKLIHCNLQTRCRPRPSHFLNKYPKECRLLLIGRGRKVIMCYWCISVWLQLSGKIQYKFMRRTALQTTVTAHSSPSCLERRLYLKHCPN